MHTQLNTPTPKPRQWVYATLTVLDGQRKLKPTHVGPDQLYFRDPPRITSSEIEIIVVNGEAEYRYTASVLPHDPDSARVPIQLAPAG